MVELYDQMRTLSSYERVPIWEVHEYFHDLNSILYKSGYQGLRHKGGVLSSRPKKHEVNIYWNPGKDLDIKPVSEITGKNLGGSVTQPLYSDKRYLI